MANAASDFGKQLVTRTPEVAGGLLRSIVDFAIDGSPAFPGAKATAAVPVIWFMPPFVIA